MLCCQGFIDLARDKFDLENGFRLRDLSGLRSTTSNLYMTFLDEMAPAVVGRAKWDKSKHLVDIHSIITTSDEAFLLLCSENYINVWTNDDPEKVTTLCPMSSFCANTVSHFRVFIWKTPKPRYLTLRSKRGAGRVTGWSAAGFDRFNQLFTMVHRDRIAHADDFDKDMKDFCCKSAQSCLDGDGGQEGVTVECFHDDMIDEHLRSSNDDDNAFPLFGMM